MRYATTTEGERIWQLTRVFGITTKDKGLEDKAFGILSRFFLGQIEESEFVEQGKAFLKEYGKMIPGIWYRGVLKGSPTQKDKHR